MANREFDSANLRLQMVGLVAAGGLHYLTVQSFQLALKPIEMILERAIHGESSRPNCSGFQFTQRPKRA